MFARMLRDGRAAEAERVGNLQQLVGHQRDVGGLERGVGAGDAHRDADVGGGERRRVVDAVADHRHACRIARAAPRPLRTLSSGSSAARALVDADRLGERAPPRLVIAGEQHDVAHALVAQQLRRRRAPSRAARRRRR